MAGQTQWPLNPGVPKNPQRVEMLKMQIPWLYPGD